MRWRTIPWLPARPWLGAQRVHIRPSRAGLAFAALLLALWIAAVNYGLGLGYALTYFAAACAIADMLFSSRNLAGLALAAAPGKPVFTGSHALFTLRLINRSRRPRHAIHVAVSGSPVAPGLADITAHGETAVSIGVPAQQRGWLNAPAVRLSGSFPLGLFVAWCHWQPEARVLVYPQPEQDAPPLPWLAGTIPPAREQGWPDSPGGAQELTGVRAYQPGDPLQRLAGARSPAMMASIYSASNSSLAPTHQRTQRMARMASFCSTTPPCTRWRRKRACRAWPPGCCRRKARARHMACVWAS